MGHDKLNVLVLDALGVHVIVIVLVLVIVLLLLVISLLSGFAGLAVVVAGVVGLGVGLGELGSGGLLGGGVEILDLGLTEDTAGRDNQLPFTRRQLE